MGLNVKPLADRVVVEPAPPEDKTSGGIILPDTAQENHSMVLWLPWDLEK